MNDQPIQTGAKSALGSLRLEQTGKSKVLIHTLVAYTGWLLLLFIAVLFLLSPELRENHSGIYLWFLVFIGYQLALEILSRTRKTFYETSGFRMARIQIMIILASALVFLTGGIDSFFWFVFLWPLFATALYTSWAGTWAIFCETTVLYFVITLSVAGSFNKIDIPLLLANLTVLLVVTVVLRLFVDAIRRYQAAQGRVEYYEMLQEVQRDVETAVDLQSVLDSILRRAVQSVGARDGTLMLLDRTGELCFRARYGGLVPADKSERTFKRGEGVAGWVLGSRRPYVCHDTKRDTHFTRVIDGPPIGSLVCVPIISHGTALGVINVDSSDVGRFTDADAELLLTLADQTAIAIERAELLDGLKEVGEKALRGGQELYQTIVDIVNRLIRCPVALWRVDPENSAQAGIIAHEGLRPEYAQHRVLDLETSIVGQVIRTTEYASLFDIQEDPRVSKETKAEADLRGWKSLLVVPLLTRSGEATGALSVYSSTRREFTRWETDLLRAFAGQAGIAIQNTERLQALRQVSTMIGSGLSLEEVGRKILDELKKVIDYHTASLQVIRGETETRALVAGRGFDVQSASEWPLRPLSKDPLIKRLVENRKPLILSRPSEDPDWEVRDETIDVHSWVGLPLVQRDRVIGLLTLDHNRPGFYTPIIEDFLVSFASYAATAIDNAERTKQLVQLQEVTTAISTQLTEPGGMGEVYRRIVNGIIEIFPGASCGIRSYDPEVDEFEPLEATGLLVGILDRPPRPNGASRFAIVQKAPRYLEEEMLTASGDGGPSLNENLLGLGIKAVAYLPLVSETDAVGVLYVNFTTSHRFSPDDRRILELFANQAAIALKNARLYRNVQNRAEAIAFLQQVSHEISKLSDVREILITIVQGALRLTNMDAGVIHLIDEVKMSINDSYEFPENFRHLPSRFSEKEGLTWDIFQTGEIREVSDISLSDPVLAERNWGKVRALIGVPLMLAGRVLGVLFLNSFKPRVLTDSDKALLTTLAEQASLAIDNAQRYEQRMKDIAALEEINEAITTKTWPEIAGLIALQAAELSQADYGGLWLVEDGSLVLAAMYPTETVTGAEPPPQRFLIDESSINGWVAKSGEPYRALDVNDDPHYRQWLQDIRSSAAAPMRSQGRIVGTLSIESTKSDAFSDHQIGLLQSLADQAAVAIENVRLYGELDSTVAHLQTLTDSAAELITRGIQDVNLVPDMIYKAAEDVMDLSDAQVQFAFYDWQKDEVSFPLAIERNDGDVIDVIRWSEREFHYRKGGEEETVEQFKPRARMARFGLTEYVIHTKKPMLIGMDFEKTANALRVGESSVRVWPQFGRLERPTHSWLGVPMMVGDRVVGVISIQSLEKERAFGQGHVKLLSVIADLAAVAIEVARLYADQKRKVQQLRELHEALVAQRELAALGTAIANLQHRISNDISVVGLNVPRLRSRVDPLDETIAKSLDIIERNARHVSEIMERIHRTLQESETQNVDINAILNEVIARVQEKWDGEQPPSPVVVRAELDGSNPQTRAPIGQLTEVFHNLLDNAYRVMMNNGGELVVSSCLSEGVIFVRVQDTGPGIPISKQQRLYKKPVPSQEPGGGTGLGLWLNGLVLQSIGGSAIIESTDSTGTTMLVQLPALAGNEEMWL